MGVVSEAFLAYFQNLGAGLRIGIRMEKQIFIKKEGRMITLAVRVALFGAGANHMIKGGTGSGDVNERK